MGHAHEARLSGRVCSGARLWCWTVHRSQARASRRQIAFTGIEVDGIAARIARKLFPKQWIRHEDFTKSALATTYDLAIGNPPFSNRLVNAVDHRELRGFSLHDWFIARSVGALRPGGFAAFVTSRHTLDKTDQKARQHIAEEADLLGAVRLPAGAMRADAGTEVVLDLLVFRKRMIGELPGDQAWLEAAPVPDSDEGRGPLRINRYFLDNPAQVLGRHGWASSQFGLDYCCLPVSGVDLETALPEALACIAPETRFLPPVEQRITRPELDGLRVGTAASGADLKEGSYYLHNRTLHQIVGGTGQEVPIRKGDQKEGLFQKHARIIEALIPVRDAAKAVLRAQMDNQPFGRHQHRLRQTWQSFTRQFGPINLTHTTVRVNAITGEETESRRRPNLQPFYDDPDVWLVSSIEEYDEATQTARPGPLFTERVIHAPVEPEIHSAHDALAVCLHDAGRVDLPLIAELTGCSVDEALNELGEAVYLDPEASCTGSDVWVAADELLSGAVRTKLMALVRQRTVIPVLPAPPQRWNGPSRKTSGHPTLPPVWVRPGCQSVTSSLLPVRCWVLRLSSAIPPRWPAGVSRNVLFSDGPRRRQSGARNAATLVNCSKTRSHRLPQKSGHDQGCQR